MKYTLETGEANGRLRFAVTFFERPLFLIRWTRGGACANSEFSEPVPFEDGRVRAAARPPTRSLVSGFLLRSGRVLKQEGLPIGRPPCLTKSIINQKNKSQGLIREVFLFGYIFFFSAKKLSSDEQIACAHLSGMLHHHAVDTRGQSTNIH